MKLILLTSMTAVVTYAYTQSMNAMENAVIAPDGLVIKHIPGRRSQNPEPTGRQSDTPRDVPPLDKPIDHHQRQPTGNESRVLVEDFVSQHPKFLPAYFGAPDMSQDSVITEFKECLTINNIYKLIVSICALEKKLTETWSIDLSNRYIFSRQLAFIAARIKEDPMLQNLRLLHNASTLDEASSVLKDVVELVRKSSYLGAVDLPKKRAVISAAQQIIRERSDYQIEQEKRRTISGQAYKSSILEQIEQNFCCLNTLGGNIYVFDLLPNPFIVQGTLLTVNPVEATLSVLRSTCQDFAQFHDITKEILFTLHNKDTNYLRAEGYKGPIKTIIQKFQAMFTQENCKVVACRFLDLVIMGVQQYIDQKTSPPIAGIEYFDADAEAARFIRYAQMTDQELYDEHYQEAKEDWLDFLGSIVVNKVRGFIMKKLSKQ